MILNSLYKLFLVLTIINIPIMILFHGGEVKRSTNDNNLKSILRSFTMGNLGQNEIICNKVVVAESSTFKQTKPSEDDEETHANRRWLDHPKVKTHQ